VTSPSTWGDVVLQAVGSLWYATVTTAGLVGLGVVWVVWRAREGASRTDRDLALLFVAAVGLVAVVGAAQLRQGGRADFLIYGRYVEPLLGAPIALGVVALFELSVRRLAAGVLVVGGVIAASWLALVSFHPDVAWRLPMAETNVAALMRWIDIVGRLDVGRLTVGAIGVVVVVGAARAVSPLLASLAVAALFVVSGSFMSARLDDHSVRFRAVAKPAGDVITAAGFGTVETCFSARTDTDDFCVGVIEAFLTPWYAASTDFVLRPDAGWSGAADAVYAPASLAPRGASVVFTDGSATAEDPGVVAVEP
jgi:hypothetical protein